MQRAGSQDEFTRLTAITWVSFALFHLKASGAVSFPITGWESEVFLADALFMMVVGR